MSSFTEFSAPLNIQFDAQASKILGKDYWRVTKAFRYYLRHEDGGEWVYVPAGYLTDGASVPRLFWSLLPPWGAYGQAAVVHDIVCEYLSITVNGMPRSITRKACDDILFEAMVVLNVPAYKRRIIELSVNAYRRLSGVRRPSSMPKKRTLEARWSG
ncbi:DUF1353 domain-containing protein [Pseudomonas koreensis]|jgi:hypothetical protein|uniref:DUF1353 domain-containing protein n=1 Tax=Pseudomonas koreensis TaxID=198620 RepID=UPI001B3287E6|nr:DUF1353 domain-containing protein [Pseudomonas koreensis]MBP4002535.1 DUF1353 domain-containing protein [Pseudomonas koreensis]